MLSTSPVLRHVACIRGIVEVTRSMRNVDTKERLRIANVCKDVLLTPQGLIRFEPGLTGMVEKLDLSDTAVQVVIDETHVEVLHEDHLISSQMIKDISVISALKDTKGLLVIIGKCQKRGKRVAVVLDMSSDKKADLVINDCQKVKEAMNDSRITAPVGMVKPLPVIQPKDLPPSIIEERSPSNSIIDKHVECLSSSVTNVDVSHAQHSTNGSQPDVPAVPTFLPVASRNCVTPPEPPKTPKPYVPQRPKVIKARIRPPEPPKTLRSGMTPHEPPKPLRSCVTPPETPKPLRSCVTPPETPKPLRSCVTPPEPPKPLRSCVTPPEPPKPLRSCITPPEPPKPLRSCATPPEPPKTPKPYIPEPPMAFKPYVKPPEPSKNHKPCVTLSAPPRLPKPYILEPPRSPMSYIPETPRLPDSHMPEAPRLPKPYTPEPPKTFKTCVTSPEPPRPPTFSVPEPPKIIKPCVTQPEPPRTPVPYFLQSVHFPAPFMSSKASVTLHDTPRVGLVKPELSQLPSSFKPDAQNDDISPISFSSLERSSSPQTPPRPPSISTMPSQKPKSPVERHKAQPPRPPIKPKPIISSPSSSPTPNAKKGGKEDPILPPTVKTTPSLPSRRPTDIIPNPNKSHPKSITPEASRSTSVCSSSTNTSLYPISDKISESSATYMNYPEETYYSDADTGTSSIYDRNSEICDTSVNATENPYYSEPDSETSAFYGQFNHPATANSSQDITFPFNIYVNSTEGVTGSSDFQSESNQKVDNMPVLLSFHNRQSLSPSPQASNRSRFSSASDSSWSDGYDEPEYVAQETFYTSLGISVEDSERIYMNKPIRQIKKSSKYSTSLEEINSFLLEDKERIEKFSRINMAREDMQHQLQNHLRGTQTLCKVHQDIHEELEECGDSYSKISKVLIKYKERFEPHIYYIKKAPDINDNLKTLPADLLQKYPGIKDDIRCSWTILNFYLINLESFLKKAPEEDKPALTEAIEMLRDLSRQADTEILLAGVKGAPYPLYSLGSLLLHSSFQVTGPLLKRNLNIRILLFPKTIVITQHKNNKYDFLLDLPIMQSYFGPMKEEKSKCFSIEVNYGGIQGKKLYIFTAPNKDVKVAWVSQITRLIGKFAEEEKKIQNKRNAVEL